MLTTAYTQAKKLIQKAGFKADDRSFDFDTDKYRWVRFSTDEFWITIIKNEAWYGLYPVLFYSAGIWNGDIVDFSKPCSDHINSIVPQEVQELLKNQIFINNRYDLLNHFSNSLIMEVCKSNFDKSKIKPYSDMIEDTIGKARVDKLSRMVSHMRQIIEQKQVFGESIYYYEEVLRLFTIAYSKLKDMCGVKENIFKDISVQPGFLDRDFMVTVGKEMEDVRRAFEQYSRNWDMMNRAMTTPILPREIHQSNANTSGIIICNN